MYKYPQSALNSDVKFRILHNESVPNFSSLLTTEINNLISKQSQSFNFLNNMKTRVCSTDFPPKFKHISEQCLLALQTCPNNF